MNSYAQVPKTWDMDENGLLGVSCFFLLLILVVRELLSWLISISSCCES